MATEFDRRHLPGTDASAGELLSRQDSSALLDYGDVVQRDVAGMRAFLAGREAVIIVVGAALLPMAPWVFTAVPAKRLLEILGQVLL